jgi:hypothetical protein
MTMDVYPALQVTPATVTNSGGSSGQLDFVERFGPLTGGFRRMHIRYAMSDAGCAPAAAPAPSLFLVTNGTEHAITSLNNTNPTPVDGGNAYATIFPEPNGVFRVEVSTNLASFPTPIAWKIRFVNNDTAVDHLFTWVVADVVADTRQPWIELPHTADWTALNGKTLTGQAVQTTLQVANKGTGNLVVSNTPGPLGTSGFELVSVPAAIPPGRCGNLVLRFTAPASPGQSAATFTATANPADTTVPSGNPAATHNAQVDLTAAYGQLEVTLLLDTSGSMGYKPDGTLPVAATDSRWAKLTDAAVQFLDLLGDFGDGLGSFALAIFPDITAAGFPPAPSPSAATLHGPVAISSGAIGTAKAAIAGPLSRKPVPKGGATPIGHGIGISMGTDAGSFGHFDDTPAGIANNERWLVLMSDGAFNSGIHPDVFYRADEGCAGTGSAGDGESFLDKRVRAITVAYGDPAVTAFEVDHALLAKIACKSAGGALDARADDVGLELLKQFRTAITATLALDPTSDPGGVLTSGNPEHRRTATVLPFDTRVAFVVNWVTAEAGRVTLQLLTPTCELITPQVAQADPNIGFHEHPRYLIYTVEDAYLRNAADPANPRYGDWTLVIAAPGLIVINLPEGPEVSANSEPYEYEVLTESRLRLRLTTGRDQHFAGDPIEVTASLRLDGAPVSEAGVTLDLDAPGQAAMNWLAMNLATPEELAEAGADLGDPEATGIGIKAHALKRKGLGFDPLPAGQAVPMAEVAPGTYRVALTNTSTPGTYTVHVTAIGTVEDVTFRREQVLHLPVGVRPLPEFTILDVAYRSLGELGIEAVARVRPLDRFGNVVMVDPAIDDTIAITATGATFTSPITTPFDGSYRRTLQLPAGGRPTISVSVAGTPVISDRLVPLPADLIYVDVVQDFRLGGEAEEGANQHRDPAAVLGDPLADPEGFLALGAAGSVTVAIAGQVIRGRGPQDVTVFVPPDATPRSYLVEALYHRGHRWVQLGTSPGVTQSFSLAEHGLPFTRAIRVTDTSLARLEPDLTVSHAPGANIAGVGVAAVGKPSGCALPGWLGHLLQWLLRWLRRSDRRA